MFNLRKRFVPNNVDDLNHRNVFVKFLIGVIIIISTYTTLLYGLVFGIITFLTLGGLSLYPMAKNFWCFVGKPRINNFYSSEMFNCYKIYHVFSKHLIDVADSLWLTNAVFLPMVFVSSKSNGIYEVKVENYTIGKNIADMISINVLKGALYAGLTVTNVNLSENGNYYIFKIIDTEFDNQLVISKSMLNLSDHVIPLSKNREWDYLKNPHAIIAGSTGSGKTYFASYLYCTILSLGATVTVIDPKKGELSTLINDNSSIENDLQKIEKVADMMAIKEQKPYDERKTDFLIIDELAALRSAISKSDSVRLDNAIKKIGLMGRSSKTILILIAQQANAQNIATELREQMGMRIMLGTATKSALGFLFPDFKGDYYGKTGSGLLSINLDSEPFTAPILDDNLDFDILIREILYKI